MNISAHIKDTLANDTKVSLGKRWAFRSVLYSIFDIVRYDKEFEVIKVDVNRFYNIINSKDAKTALEEIKTKLDAVKDNKSLQILSSAIAKSIEVFQEIEKDNTDLDTISASTLEIIKIMAPLHRSVHKDSWTKLDEETYQWLFQAYVEKESHIEILDQIRDVTQELVWIKRAAKPVEPAKTAEVTIS